jgi:PRC-barrel domain
MNRRMLLILAGLGAAGFPASAIQAGPIDPPLVLAQQTAEPAKDDSPEAKMNRRFPQKVRVGDLISLPMLDDNDVTLGQVVNVVRTPSGRIRLIVSYSKWFGWFGRPVAVPIEAVAILGRQIDSLDMQPPAYAAAPTWSQGDDKTILDDEIIRIAISRR